MSVIPSACTALAPVGLAWPCLGLNHNHAGPFHPPYGCCAGTKLGDAVAAAGDAPAAVDHLATAFTLESGIGGGATTTAAAGPRPPPAKLTRAAGGNAIVPLPKTLRRPPAGPSPGNDPEHHDGGELPCQLGSVQVPPPPSFPPFPSPL